MKKVISLFLSVLMLISLLGAVDLSAFAAKTITGIDFVYNGPYARGSVLISKFIREKQGNKLVLYYSDSKSDEYVCKYKSGKKAFYNKDGKCIEGSEIEFSYDNLDFGNNIVTITYNKIKKDTNLVCIQNDVTAIDFTFASDVAIKERADGNYYSDIVAEINHVGNKFAICDSNDVVKEYTCVYDKNAKANIFVDSDKNELLIKSLIVDNQLSGLKVGTKNTVRIYAFDLKFFCDTKITVVHADKVTKNKKAATCTAKGYTGDKVCPVCNTKFEKGKSIDKTSHNYKITKATLTADGANKCKNCGKVKKTYYYPKTIKLSKKSYVYDGEIHKPTVTVKDSNGKKINSKYYTVTYPSGMKKVGEYKVKIKFKGDYYKGSTKLTYTIVPKTTKIKSVTPKSKSFSFTWKKVSTQTSGYQIQCSTKSDFSSAKTYALEDTSRTSATIGGLKSKKKYYVRMRTFKTIKGVRYYSAWSNTMTVKTQK